MKQLFRCADHYIQSRDWKMLTGLKFCLCSIGILFGLLMYCGVLGDGSAPMANQNIGFSLVILFAILYVGDLLGWIVYGCYRRMKQQREDMQL